MRLIYDVNDPVKICYSPVTFFFKTLTLYISRGPDQGSCSLPFPPQTYDFGVIVDCKSTYAEHFR